MSDKLPQSEGADWFLVLDEGGAIEFAYTADFGRSFGHEHINDAMQDSQLRHLAKNWVVRPAYSQSTVDLLRARIAELEQENFTLAAGACVVDGGLVGGEGGSPVCILRERIAELERALSWYADEARALAKNVAAGAHTTGVLASVTVLALDGGRNADELLKDKRPHLSLPALQRLGARLAELLDEDQWAECERMLLEAGVTLPLPKATKP